MASSVRRKASSRRNAATSISRMRRVDDDRAERGLREVRQHRPGEQQDGHHGRRRGQGVQLGPAASRDADGGPGRAAADREAVHQARAGVGGAQRQQLPVGRDLLPAPRERSRGQHVIAEPHDQHGERRQQQLAQHTRVDIGQPGTGRPAGIGPTTATPGWPGRTPRRQRWLAVWPAAGPARVATATAARTGRPGPPPRPRPWPAESARGRGRTKQTWAQEVLPGDRHAGHPPELVGDHDHRHARHVADQDRPRQQIRHKSQPQQPGNQRHRSDQQRQRGSEHGVPRRVTRGQRPDRDRRHQRGRRLRAHRQGPRRAEHRIDHQRGQGRPQTRDRGHSRDRRVRHDLRNQVRRHGDAGDQVTAQPRTLVAAQHCHP